MSQSFGKYGFSESLSKIIDDQNHPLHKIYVDALKSIHRPCTHGPVILTDNPNELFPEETIISFQDKGGGWKIPKMDRPCADFTGEYDLYAFLGAGAFGAVYAARTRGNVRDGKPLHVAVKFTPITAAKKQAGGIIRHDEFGLIFNEVLALALLRDNPGVPALYAVYAHGCTLITVMELFGAWPVKDDLGALPELDFDHIPDAADLVRLRPCDGLELSTPHRYIPGFRRPGEMDVCKMSSIHLSTLQQMKERGCSHEDIAHRNIVINETYDAKFIDWGGAQFHPSEKEWFNNRFTTRQETAFIPPEWVASGRDPLPRRKGRMIDDHRRNDLWRFSCVMYDYLHDSFPYGFYGPQGERELRLRHGEFKVNGDLSQDCIDAFKAMFEQDPQSRGRTEDLVTLPWFSGSYLDTSHTFENILQSPLVPRPYSHPEPEYGPPRSFHSMSVTCYGNPITTDINTVYRCFAEWEYKDQNRWQDIKVRTLDYYTAFMAGRLYSGDPRGDAAKRQVYQRIDHQTPRGVIYHLQNVSQCPTMRMIRIIADALHCQAVVLHRVGNSDDDPYRINIYGNIHDRDIPEYFQIHLHYDGRNLFELVLLYCKASQYEYKAHTRTDIDIDSCFSLDEDHRDILLEKQTVARGAGGRAPNTVWSDSIYYEQSGSEGDIPTENR
ncbi:MAG: hypothetical protein M1839_007350 [Geoglossum umbratile]|nr:MAG: hypothetical protein M1839_007350 [Geoglossum umbratile]